MGVEAIGQGVINSEIKSEYTYIKPKVNDIGNSIQAVINNMETNPAYVPTVQEKTLIRAIEDANKKLNGSEREFEFSIHEKTKQIMVKVLDKSTKEIIREIPSEKILDMVAAMCEGAGLFVDKKL